MRASSRSAIVGRSAGRGTTASTRPRPRRNSAVWNPSGSPVLIVCSITRGPANPIRAPGSAMMTSPSVAYDAATPP
ncbi:hypothetical protein ACFQHO_12530 [Actinomadura yumaensis]|uniref:hypothetical protein n=1 Tax=Actinomadura yumaensis TaxID=111807 RepID=UPI00362211BB